MWCGELLWLNTWAFCTSLLMTWSGFDYFWTRAVVLLGPLMVTTGMVMTTPIGMISHLIFKQKRLDYLYTLGSILIFTSFVSISLYDFEYLRRKKKAQSENDVDEGRTESVFSLQMNLNKI